MLPIAKLLCSLTVAVIGFKFLAARGFCVYIKSGKSFFVSNLCLPSIFKGTSLLESLHWIKKNIMNAKL